MKRKKKFPFSSYEEFEQNMMALENGEEKEFKTNCNSANNPFIDKVVSY